MLKFGQVLDRFDLPGVDTVLIIDEVCHAEDCVTLESLAFVLTKVLCLDGS